MAATVLAWRGASEALERGRQRVGVPVPVPVPASRPRARDRDWAPWQSPVDARAHAVVLAGPLGELDLDDVGLLDVAMRRAAYDGLGVEGGRLSRGRRRVADAPLDAVALAVVAAASTALAVVRPLAELAPVAAAVGVACMALAAWRMRA